MSNTAKKPMSTLKLTQLAILMALIAVLAFTPLGFIIIPPISMTIMHIPVIIGAILLGPMCGGILGSAFGIFSMIRAVTTGNIADALFSPFASGNPIASIIMCIVPRILLGVIAGYAFILLKRMLKKDYIAMAISAGIATICHTVMVLGCLWGFFSSFPLITVFKLVVQASGLLEITAAVIIVTAVCKPLMRVRK